MIEVFRTNVVDTSHANMLVVEIQRKFEGYTANFDLDDCDKILRVESSKGIVKSYQLIDLLELLGFKAEVLPD